MYIICQVAGFSGAAAVGLGAFGAHGLRARVTDPYLLEIWNRAASYHQIHSLAVCAAACCANSEGRPAFVAASLFSLGIALFSGSLYALVSCPDLRDRPDLKKKDFNWKPKTWCSYSVWRIKLYFGVRLFSLLVGRQVTKCVVGYL